MKKILEPIFIRKVNIALVIGFVKHLSNKRKLGTAYQYRMHIGKTGALISIHGALSPDTVAHEIGHILGAQHGN